MNPRDVCCCISSEDAGIWILIECSVTLTRFVSDGGCEDFLLVDWTVFWDFRRKEVVIHWYRGRHDFTRWASFLTRRHVHRHQLYLFLLTVYRKRLLLLFMQIFFFLLHFEFCYFSPGTSQKRILLNFHSVITPALPSESTYLLGNHPRLVQKILSSTLNVDFNEPAFF